MRADEIRALQVVHDFGVEAVSRAIQVEIDNSVLRDVLRIEASLELTHELLRNERSLRVRGHDGERGRRLELRKKRRDDLRIADFGL